MKNMHDSHALAQNISAVIERIRKLQSGDGGRYIIFSHDPIGLGGQISRRVLAVRVGLLLNRTVVFPEESFYPYENAFEPLGTLPELMREASPKLDFNLWADDPNTVVEFDFWAFWENEAIKKRVYESVPEEFEGLENAHVLTEGVIFSEFKLKPRFLEAISPKVELIRNMEPVVGVHYRRGDKYVETPYVEADIYRREVMRVADASNVKNIFVSSDSAQAIAELKLPKSYNIYFDEEEVRYNNANHKFLMRRQDLALQETVTALKNIYMLGECNQVVGQTNAHFANLAAGSLMVKYGRLDFGVLIKPNLVPTKWAQRHLYKSYKIVRSIAKRVFSSTKLLRT